MRSTRRYWRFILKANHHDMIKSGRIQDDEKRTDKKNPYRGSRDRRRQSGPDPVDDEHAD